MSKMSDIQICGKVVNKESRRVRGNLFHKILLKKANSQLIYEMVKNDPTKETNKYVRKHTPHLSTANKVAWYILSN